MFYEDIRDTKRMQRNLFRTHSWLVALACGIYFLASPLDSFARVSAAGAKSYRDRQCKYLNIVLESPGSPLIEREIQILENRTKERTGITPRMGMSQSCAVELNLRKGIGRDGFDIEPVPRGVRITGNDPRGLLYGIGKFLRTNTYHQGSLVFGDWHGRSVPEMRFREIYFATHFHNFYEEAPVEEINRYVEDLALWGYNGVDVWFDMHTFNGIDDPAAQTMIKRLNVILKAAKGLGLDTGLMLVANEAYANSPVALRADETAGHDGYFATPQGNYAVQLCPSKPGAKELMLKWREGTFRAFRGVGINHITIWPYDPGGCTDRADAPWGSNGFLKMAKPIAKMARQDFPGCKIILSTWRFNHFTSGEWDGLDRKFGNHQPGWVDYIMAGADGGLQRFLGNPPKHRVPGDLPLLSFPDIAMWGAMPWGGFGANPLPKHDQQMWELGKDTTEGGFPYSEGIFDDLNKVTYSQLYWGKGTSTDSIVDEYVSYEFSPEIVEPMRKAIAILEEDYPRTDENVTTDGARVRFVLTHSSHAAEAYQLFQQMAKKLSPKVQNSWRWRILYLRALIDDELVKNDFYVSPRCENAFEQLTEIYYGKTAAWTLTPPTKEAIERYRRATKKYSYLKALEY